MKVKITTKDGIYTVAGSRDLAGSGEFPELATGFSKEYGKITRISSTEAQPHIAANFSADGAFVGGRTMTDGQLQAIIKAATDAGLDIDYMEK